VALYATTAAVRRHAELIADAEAAGHRVDLVSDDVMAAMADTVTPQGLLAVCRLVDVALDVVVAGRPRLVAVLANVRDPGNAGTVIRAADAAGARAVVLAGDSVDVHNPKCVRSTAGSLFHLSVVSGVALADAVATLRSAGLQVVATAGSGQTSLDDLLDDPDTALRLPTAWVFGNEGWGLSPDDQGLADLVVRVPIYGQAESLNLAAAATVCLYASAFAQRRANSP
jgi:TrmH family RNA methyltransferase